MKKLSKILIPVLLLAMLFTLVTVVASAEGEEAQIGEQKYATLADAMKAAQPGDTVTLLKDVSLTATSGQIRVDKQLTVDLAGHKLSYTDGSSAGSDYGTSAFHAVTGADLTVTSSGAVAPVAIECNDGLVTVPAGSKGVKVTLSNLNIDYDSNISNAGMIYLEAPCELTMNHVTAVHRHINNWGAAILVASTSDTGTYKWNITNSTLNGGKKCIIVSKNVGINATFTNSRITADSFAIGRKGTDPSTANYKSWQGQAIALDLAPVNTAGTTFVFEGCYISSGYRTITFNDINPNNVKLTFRNTECKAGPTLTGDIAEGETISQNSLLLRGNPTVSFEGTGNKIWLRASTNSFLFAGDNAAKAPVFIDEGTVLNVNSVVCNYATITYADGCSIYANPNAETKREFPFIRATTGTPAPDMKLNQDFTGTKITTSAGGGISGIGATGLYSGGIKQGNVSVVQNADGNYYFKYATDGVMRGTDGKYDAYNGICPNGGFVFASNSYLVADWDFMAEDAYFKSYFQINIRDSSGKSAQQNNGRMGPAITPNADGSAVLSHQSSDDGKTYTKTLDVNTWYHITVAFKVDKTDVTKSMLVWFLNGEYIGSHHNVATAAAAKIDLIGRWAVNTGTLEQLGKSMCLDNMRLAFYTTAFEQIENTVFCTAEGQKPTLVGCDAAVWNEHYPLLNGKIYASVTSGETSTYYYSFDEALNAAKDGDTLTLYTDVTDQYPVTKAITIVKNGYSASAANFYSSSTGESEVLYDITETAEELTFTKATASNTVVWNIDGVRETEYYGAGNIPSYKGTNLITAKMEDGKLLVFSGWEDASGNALTTIPSDTHGVTYQFHPVYTQDTEAVWVVLNPDESVAGYGKTADGVVTAATNISNGQTLRLMADITLGRNISFSGTKTVTFDMNGHTLITTHGTSSLTSPSYAKAESVKLEGGVALTVKNGTIFNRNTYVADGKNITNGAPAFLVGSSSLFVSDVSTYACVFLYMSGNCTVVADRVNAYRNVADYSALIVGSNGEVNLTIRNSILTGVVPGGPNVFDFRSASGAKYTVTVDNCTLGGARGSDDNLLTAPFYGVDMTITNSRIFGRFNVAGTSSTVTLGEGCYLNRNDHVFAFSYASGCELVKNTANVPVTYSYNTFGDGVTVEGTEQILNYTCKEDAQNLPMAYITATAENIVTVNWNKGGKTVTTEKYFRGSVATAPAVPASIQNGSYTVTFTDWGYDGAALNENKTFEAEYTLTVGAKYNLSLYADFDVNFYLPTDITDVVFNGEKVTKSDGTATVDDGKEYNVYSVGRAANATTNNITLTVTVTTADGQTYSVVYTTNIVDYTMSVLAMGEKAVTEAEGQMLVAMLQYAQQACVLLNKAEDATLTAALNHANAQKYTVPDVKGYDGEMASTGELNKVFVSAQLDLTSAPKFVFNVKDDFNGTVTVRYNGNTVARTFTGTQQNAKIEIDDLRIYNFDTTFHISVDGTEIGTYNLGAYTGAVALGDFPQALYNYIAAAKAYKTAVAAG